MIFRTGSVSSSHSRGSWPSGRGRAEAAVRLAAPEQALGHSRLQREDAFRLSMTEAERRWLRQHRPPEAAQWNVLTNLSAADLAHGA